MKKVKGRMLLILAACLVMLVTGAVSVSAATLKAGSEGVTTTGVNMRSKASKSASRLTTIPRGYTVYIKGAAGGWYHVYYNGKTGYCSSNYVKDIITVAKNKWMTTRVMAASIRMRKSASSNAKVLLTIKSGKRVVILGKTSSGRWYKVSSYGRIGYIEAGYFTTDAKTLYAKSGVNMRKGPATSYKRILTVPKGGKVICYKKVFRKLSFRRQNILFRIGVNDGFLRNKEEDDGGRGAAERPGPEVQLPRRHRQE